MLLEGTMDLIIIIITAAAVPRTLIFGTNLSCKNDHTLFLGYMFLTLQNLCIGIF